MNADPEILTGAWAWWVSTNNENYAGPYGSREEAIEEGVSDECGLHEGVCTFYIMEAIQRPLNIADTFDVGRGLEDAEDGGKWSDLMGEDGDGLAEHVTPAQWGDLDARLRRAATEWHIANAVVIKPWAFTDQRNSEVVTVAVPVAA